ncbi:hypothetical protein DFQ26_007362 [Actinomortierella ambigua]|nr:hypothetical protein DFQ26_007362 [Actinomortierella ambigua]
MNRNLDNKAKARAALAPAPIKKKKLHSLIVKPKTSKTNTTTTTKSAVSNGSSTSSNTKKRKASVVSTTKTTPEHDLDFISLFSPNASSSSAALLESLKPSSRDTLSDSNNEDDDVDGDDDDLAISDDDEDLLATSSGAGSRARAAAAQEPTAKRIRTAPQVVVCDGSTIDRKGLSKTSASAGGTDFHFKSFMSSKISKLDEAPLPMKDPLTDQEKEEELQNKKHDAELHSLIMDSRILEQYNAEQLTGADRRRHQKEQMVRLGIQTKEKIKVPFQVGLGMRNKQRERDMKALQEAKDNGTYHKSIKHLYAASGGKKKEKSRSERGLKSSLGQFKGGVLTISQKEIKAVQRESSSKKSSGGKKGKGKKGRH